MINEQDSLWQDFQFSFSVPKTDCPAQFVTLSFRRPLAFRAVHFWDHLVRQFKDRQ